MAAKTKDAGGAQPAAEWDGIVRRELEFEYKAINPDERSFEVVASTDTLDSYGDIVEQTFNLKRYKKNPVILWFHNNFGFLDGSTAEDFLPIGRAEGTKVNDGQLETKIVLVAGTAAEEPLVDKIWRRVQQKILRAVSIGFRPGKITEEKRDGGTVYRLSDNELYEISVVPIPANPDAVAKAVAMERDRFKVFVEFEAQRLAALKAPPNDSSRALAAEGNENPTRESAEDNDMDPKELQAQLDKVKGELAVANAALETAKTTAAADAQKAADKVKELEGKLSGLETKCTELSDSLKEATAALEKHAEAEKAAEKVRAEADVDAVIGKKISPASREKWLTVRLRSKAEFDELLADMPELSVLKDITPPATKGGVGTPPAAGLQSLIEEANA